MKKVLMVASVASMIDQFNVDNLRILKELGCDIDVAANFNFGSSSSQSRVDQFRKELGEMNVNVIDIPFPRRIGSLRANVKVYIKLKNIINKNEYSLIHAHSPIGGFITRLAAIRARIKGTRIIYTAHGFHFFKGASLINWFVFYPIEYILSFVTDTIITINKEDYKRAQDFHAVNVVYIPGVGVNINKISSVKVNVDEKKKELGIPLNAFIVLSVGELSKRKNQEVIIRAISLIKRSNIYYVICGKGEEEVHLRELSISLGISDRVFLLGFRTDIGEIIQIANCFAFPSKREGLGIAAIEAMSVGLPIITSNLNGILDYSINGKTGFVCAPNDYRCFSRAIIELYTNDNLVEKIKGYNLESSKQYDIFNVNGIMRLVYSNILGLQA